MKYLFKDKNDDLCGAKTWFTLSSAVILIKFALSNVVLTGVTFGSFDSTGAAFLVSAFGAVYWGRSKDK